MPVLLPRQDRSPLSRRKLGPVLRHNQVAIGAGQRGHVSRALPGHELDRGLQGFAAQPGGQAPPPKLAEITDGRPVLGAIPFDQAAKQRPLVADEDPFHPRAEAFRKVRTNLQFIDIDQPRNLAKSVTVE